MLRGFRIGSHFARRDQALDELMDWFRAAGSNSARRSPKVSSRLQPRSSTCCLAAISASRWCGSPRPPSDRHALREPGTCKSWCVKPTAGRTVCCREALRPVANVELASQPLVRDVGREEVR